MILYIVEVGIPGSSVPLVELGVVILHLHCLHEKVAGVVKGVRRCTSESRSLGAIGLGNHCVCNAGSRGTFVLIVELGVLSDCRETGVTISESAWGCSLFDSSRVACYLICRECSFLIMRPHLGPTLKPT